MGDYMEKMRMAAPAAGSRKGGPAAGHGSGAPPVMSRRGRAGPAMPAMPTGPMGANSGMAGSMRMPSASMAMAQGMGAMGTGSAIGMADTGADLQLFRYFDFDVEPGECYRYRVKLIVDNPNFEETFVSTPTVADGKFRETPWSAPTPPVVVERDVEYGLVKIRTDKGRIDGAELEVIQFDPNLGSYIMSNFPVFFGAYVGKEKQKTMHLDFLTPFFKEEPVNFTSKDVLLDSTGTPSKFSEAAEADLKLDKKSSSKLLDMAVAFDRFGEIVELDSSSLQDLKEARKRVEEEREPYDEIKETEKDKKKKAAEASSLDLPGAGDPIKGKGRKRKGKGAANPLKGGYSSSSMSSMFPGASGAPPTAGGAASGRRGRANSSRP